MIKTLYLVRHAKSSYAQPLPDKLRPIKTRGINDIQLVAKAFLKHNTVPMQVYSSPANRALTTCKLFLEVCNVSDQRIQVVDSLYDFQGQQVLNHIKALQQTVDSVIIFGHNNALHTLANTLGSTILDNLPTSGLVKIEYDIQQWSEIANGKTTEIIIPKALR